MDKFLSALTSDDLLLTVNRRLSAYLKNQYDQYKQQQGCKTWTSLSILPLYSWLEKIWEEYSQDDRVLLTDAQEQFVWEDIIHHYADHDLLLRTGETAALVKDSWRLIHEWDIDLKRLQNSHVSDVITFTEWVTSFQMDCDQKRWLSRACLLKLLLDKNHNFPFKDILPKRIWLIGFDSFSININRLIDLFKDYTEVKSWLPRQTAVRFIRTSYADQVHEISAMANWAYTQITRNANALIGCVVPNLAKIRNDVNQIFTDSFYDFGLNKKYTDLPFNISAAIHLSEYPLVHAALLILKLNQGELTIEELSCLLRSPFFAGAETELNSRALLDSYLRSLGEHVLPLRELISFVAGNAKQFMGSCKIWFRNLQVLLNTNTQTQRSCHEWAGNFNEQLKIMGWPGQRNLNSHEYQQLQRWQALLNEFAALDTILGPTSFNQAYYYLQQLTKHTAFQPQTLETPIQILGILEATGILFDQIWISGLDSETWPAAPNPNPFIPFAVQRQLHMPHATPEKELEFSQIVTERFKQSAREVIFSYPKQEADRPLLPSPLIIELPEVDPEISNVITREQQIFVSSELEFFIDEQAPPLTENVSGGSSIFKMQSLCPFRAFAELRLRAEGLDYPVSGLALHQRGSIVHNVMAILWQNIKNHETLCQYSEEELIALINTAVDMSLSTMKMLRPLSATPRFLKIETQRLQRLIMQWLQYEKQRPPFNVIACEQWLVSHIENIEVHLQIDRLDQTQQGQYLIIDYKTGKTSIHDWFGERPHEPQLPLYCIASEKKISGIAFAEIRGDKLNFKGITEFAHLLPNVTTNELLNWQELQTEWKIHLTKLASDFRSGHAQVDPKDPSRTCQYCQLHGLCRINKG